jgi:hypothetical protein
VARGMHSGALAPVGPQEPPHPAASASGWALRDAWIPPMDYRHKPAPAGISVGNRWGQFWTLIGK